MIHTSHHLPSQKLAKPTTSYDNKYYKGQTSMTPILPDFLPDDQLVGGQVPVKQRGQVRNRYPSVNKALPADYDSHTYYPAEQPAILQQRSDQVEHAEMQQGSSRHIAEDVDARTIDFAARINDVGETNRLPAPSSSLSSFLYPTTTTKVLSTGDITPYLPEETPVMHGDWWSWLGLRHPITTPWPESTLQPRPVTIVVGGKPTVITAIPDSLATYLGPHPGRRAVALSTSTGEVTGGIIPEAPAPTGVEENKRAERTRHEPMVGIVTRLAASSSSSSTSPIAASSSPCPSVDMATSTMQPMLTAARSGPSLPPLEWSASISFLVFWLLVVIIATLLDTRRRLLTRMRRARRDGSISLTHIDIEEAAQPHEKIASKAQQATTGDERLNELSPPQTWSGRLSAWWSRAQQDTHGPQTQRVEGLSQRRGSWETASLH
ncbi:MAG: hypothetical protein M1818_006295 [Claussenomyces sp. TS43310]|nr:MAG: hypothetical protein M1818_006295 [Claussenomyces sp. TS43310]